MRRSIIAMIAGALLLYGCGATKQGAYAAHGADIASTGVGLALGAAEANPLGIVALPIKLAMVEYAGSLPSDERPAAYAALSAITWGAVANNLCVIASILASAGIAAPACFAVGVGTGVAYWDATKQHRDRPRLYAYCAEPAPGAESDCKEYE